MKNPVEICKKYKKVKKNNTAPPVKAAKTRLEKPEKPKKGGLLNTKKDCCFQQSFLHFRLLPAQEIALEETLGVKGAFGVAQIGLVHVLFTVHELDSDIVILSNLLIYLYFNLSYLLGCRLCLKDIVTLGFLLLHMRIP